jgi:citrate lyase gamma subunit
MKTNDTTVIVLEGVLQKLIAKYKARCLKVSLATRGAYNIELRLRAIAELIERESAGSEFQYSQAKILEDCGLTEHKQG